LSAPPDTRGSSIDVDALRAKYREERDKRLRADGNEQFVEMAGVFSHFDKDPLAPADTSRPALVDHVDVVIVGGGFSGLLAGARLRAEGVERICIIEVGGDVGGTWYWNRYPGAQCDIESYIYLPLLEELGYMPKEKYSHGPEIYEHARRIATHFGLLDDALFSTQVTNATWQDDAGCWLIETDHGDCMTAQWLIMATGPLSKPKLPGIAGIDTYGGHAFHTSRWDYAYTGGDTTGGLTKLADKRVGIIGTGATAVQCIPHLGEWAKQLYVFQRTPSSIDVRGNRSTDLAWAASLSPGWQQERIENFGIIVSGGHQAVDLVSDGWTDILRNLSGLADRSGAEMSPQELAAQVELADFAKMEQIRARVDAVVRDQATAEALKPWYRQFCKRPCFHDDYLETFNRPNVTLVDTQGQGVQRITPQGVVVGGVEYEVDCLIFATGFEVGTEYTRRAACDLRGRDGLTLSEKWGRKVATFQGLLSRGFPNVLFMGGIQSGVSPNFTELYDEQSRHIAYIVSRARRAGARVVEPSEAAEHAWLETITASNAARSSFQSECTPGYYNNEGRPGEGPGWFGGNYGGGAQAFFTILRDWRAADDLAGLEAA
jgi:cation diffusion facilitator CzcD-associated flavoprotein CzcO